MKTGGRAEYSGSLDSIVMAVIVIEPAIEGPFCFKLHTDESNGQYSTK